MTRARRALGIRALGLALLAGAAALVVMGNAEQASAGRRQGIRTCLQMCEQQGREAERQCRRNGGSASACAQVGNDTTSLCIFLNCSDRGG